MVKNLKKKHTILCTSRRYREVSALAKIRKFSLKTVGKHGGEGKLEKLEASIDRTKKLSKIVSKFSPNLVISFCSPEASRIAYGLGIKHVGFSDSPHATAVMKLSLPFIQKLLIPWVIPKKEFTKFGIDAKDIIQYRSIDAATITKRIISKKPKLPFNPNKMTILIRPAEDQAAYVKEKSITIPIIKNILTKFKSENIVVLSRYSSQRKNLEKIFGEKIQILNMSYDGKILLQNCDVFIGSGGTMTAESALLGVPTISYNAVPNFIEEYVVKKKLAIREENPKKIVRNIEKLLSSKSLNKKKALAEISAMEDPFSKLSQVIKLMK